jgi:hypothetical protein
MELDELKQTWKQTGLKNTINTDIMEMIHYKSQGPVAAMKKVFKKQMTAMAFIPLILLVTNLNNILTVFGSALFWSYVAFCIGTVVFAWYNYRIVRKMEVMDSMVRTNLEQQINLLEKRKKWELAGMRGVLLFFIALTEIVPYFQHYRMLDYWHSLSPVIRIGTYAVLLVLQYIFNRRISERNLGRHLAYLKTLVKEMY